MSNLLKSIQTFVIAFIGIPIFILGMVTVSTTVIVLPLSFLLGWL